MATAIRSEAGARMLVVYFSRTGYTKKIANEIAARTGADLEAIEDVRPRTGIIGYFRSALEALAGRQAEIRAPQRQPSRYDLVILGTPVWAGRLASPMRTYAARHRGSFRRIAVFATEGGSGGEATLEALVALSGAESAGSLVLRDREIDAGGYAAKLSAFLGSLGRSKVGGG